MEIDEYSLAAPSDYYDDAATFLIKWEHFSAKPYWDVNAWRIGYGSDNITRANGSIVKVTRRSGPITKEDALRDLKRRILEFEVRAVRQVGSNTWDNLPGNAKAALISVTYNYGSLPSSVVSAVKGSNIQIISKAVANLQHHNNGVNRSRRLAESRMILGGQ